MNRSRMIGVLAVLAASFVAGCGGANSGGHVAAQEAPTSSDPAAATAAAPAEDPTTKALGAFPEADPNAPTLRNLDRFSESRAGTVFQEPASVTAASTSSSDTSTASDPTGTGGATSSGDSGATQQSAPATPDTSSPSTGDTTTTGSTPSSGGTTSGGTTSSGGGTTTGSTGDTTKKASAYTANMEVDGAPVIAKVDTKVPTTSPYFVVASIDADKVVLRLISGSFGTGDTVDIAKGASVTLSNPSSGSTIVIKVVDIAKAGATK